jgi:ADP-ribosylation factor-like protein 13B
VGVGEVKEGRLGDVRVRMQDVGGAVEFRALWRGMCPLVHGMVLVVDATDPARFPECRAEAAAMLQHPLALGKPIVL